MASLQPLFLRSGVHLAAVREDLITLDVEAGEYGCVPGVGRAVSKPGLDGRVDVAHAEVAELLLEADLVTHETGDAARSDLPPAARASCWRGESALLTARDRRRFAHAYLTAAPRFWLASFAVLVANAERGLSTGPEAPTPAVVRDAHVFDRLAPFAPFQGECLFRAFLLRTYLRLEGRDAAWVFGVRTYPFGAHCWLQVGDMVLDDAVERICAYTPILAV